MAGIQRLLVYPYDNDFYPVLRHTNLLRGYGISALVSPNGWGLAGKDVGEAGRADKAGIEVSGDYQTRLGECDAVLFTDSLLKLDFNKFIYPKMKDALINGKNVLCAIDIDDNSTGELTRLSLDNGAFFKLLNDHSWSVPVKEEIFDINTPVIFVVGESERTNKFEIQLALRDYFLSKGYAVSQIGTRRYCEILGFHSFPDFFFRNDFTETEKIILFNHYVKGLERIEKPDVFIIGIPGGTMKYNNKYHNHYGITAYEISQAITPDAAICSVLYEEYKPVFFEMMFSSIRYKLGFEVDFFNISTYKFDWIRTDISKQMYFTLLNSNDVTRKTKEWSGLIAPVFNVLDRHHADTMCKLVEEKLKSYAEVQAF